MTIRKAYNFNGMKGGARPSKKLLLWMAAPLFIGELSSCLQGYLLVMSNHQQIRY